MKTLIIGAGTLARLTADILSQDPNIELVGFVDIEEAEPNSKYLEYPIIGDHSVLPTSFEKGIRGAIVAVGDNFIRERHFYELVELGYELVRAIHPSAIVAGDVSIGQGVIIGAGVVVSAGSRIGNNTVIQSGAVIGIEAQISENVHIREGAIVCGLTEVQRNAYVHVGALVATRVRVGKNATISIGQCVLEDVPGVVVPQTSPDWR